MPRTDQLPALTPQEAAAIRNRITRMSPRNMTRNTDLDHLRTLDRAHLTHQYRAIEAAGGDTALIDAELDCRRALERIHGRTLPAPQ